MQKETFVFAAALFFGVAIACFVGPVGSLIHSPVLAAELSGLDTDADTQGDSELQPKTGGLDGSEPGAGIPGSGDFVPWDGFVTEERAGLRKEPWGTIAGSVSKGDRVRVTGREGEWLIVAPGHYLHSKYVSQKAVEAERKVENFVKTASTWGGKLVPTGRLTSKFGWRIHPVKKTKKFHYGVDIGVAVGTPVSSPGPGKVIYSGWMTGYGKIVQVKHDNGYVTYYAHLKAATVKVGDKVDQGSVVGKANNTGISAGSHLHFEVRKDGKAVDPQQVSGLRF